MSKVLFVSNERFALIFAALSIALIILIFALRAQRKRVYEENMFKQRSLLSQIFDMHIIKNEALRIKIDQLAVHRQILKTGKLPENK